MTRKKKIILINNLSIMAPNNIVSYSNEDIDKTKKNYDLLNILKSLETEGNQLLGNQGADSKELTQQAMRELLVMEAQENKGRNVEKVRIRAQNILNQLNTLIHGNSSAEAEKATEETAPVSGVLSIQENKTNNIFEEDLISMQGKIEELVGDDKVEGKNLAGLIRDDFMKLDGATSGTWTTEIETRIKANLTHLGVLVGIKPTFSARILEAEEEAKAEGEYNEAKAA